MKRLLPIIFFSLFTFSAGAQKKIVRGLTPHHAKVQFAGSIGFLAAGFGYENRKSTLEGDLYYGYVPKKFGGISMHSLTGKITVNPFPESKILGLKLRPLTVGALGSYTFGKQYFLFSPENYPYNYYGFPTALHAGVFVGGQLSTSFNKRSLRSVGIYYELGTNDRELKSYLGNNSIKFTEILNLAIGIKTTF